MICPRHTLKYINNLFIHALDVLVFNTTIITHFCKKTPKKRSANINIVLMNDDDQNMSCNGKSMYFVFTEIILSK